jgi:hypothetical protein
LDIGECERLLQVDGEKRGLLTSLGLASGLASDLAASSLASGLASGSGMASLGMASLGLASFLTCLACVAPLLWHGVSLFPGCSFSCKTSNGPSH